MNKRKNVVEENESEAHINSSKVSDWVKKTILTGVGAVFMTEDGIKKALSDVKMPKNMIASIAAQADKTKQEVSSMVAKEIRHFLDRIEVDEILKKSLAGQSLEITATIKFVDSQQANKTTKAKAAPKPDDDKL